MREGRGSSSSLVHRVNRNRDNYMIRCPDAIMGRDGGTFLQNGGEEVTQCEEGMN